MGRLPMDWGFMKLRLPYNQSKNRSLAQTVQLRKAFVRGADAMLEALKAKGIEVRHIRSASYEFIALGGGNATYKLSHKTPDNTDGWLIFIPEEA